MSNDTRQYEYQICNTDNERLLMEISEINDNQKMYHSRGESKARH